MSISTKSKLYPYGILPRFLLLLHEKGRSLTSLYELNIYLFNVTVNSRVVLVLRSQKTGQQSKTNAAAVGSALMQVSLNL